MNELNAQIATKVFGWEEISGEEIRKRGFANSKSRSHLKRMWVTGTEAHGCEECGSLPDFSGSLEEAWRVVEYMATHDPVNPPTEPQASGYWLRLQSPFDSRDPANDARHSWNAGFTQHSFTGWNGRPDYRGQGATAAEAICRAALAAVEGKSAELESAAWAASRLAVEPKP